MHVMGRLEQIAREHRRAIVLPESGDPRALEAAGLAAARGRAEDIVDVIVVRAVEATLSNP